MRVTLIDKGRKYMGLDVIDRHKRFSQCIGQALSKAEAYHDGADKTRTGSGSYDIKFIFWYIGFSYGRICN